MTDKAALRKVAVFQRDQLPNRDRRSRAICDQVIALPAYTAARRIHCYLPMRSEVDTRPLISTALASGKQVIVPVVIPKQAELAHTWLESLTEEALVAGTFGTAHPRDLRPAALGDWDVTIVPLLAFDRQGHRLGYGKGFYDRLLAASKVPAIGVAFAAQEVTVLPTEPHDMRLPVIVTEQEVLIL